MRCASALVLLGLSGVALASDADPFDPSGSLIYGTGTVSAESPVAPDDTGFAGGLHGNVAEDLAVVSFSDGTERPILGTTFATVFQGSWNQAGIARFDLFVPMYPYVEAPTEEFQGAALGDVRIQGMVPIVSLADGAFSVGALVELGLPTGSAKPLLKRGFYGQVGAAVGGELDLGLGYVANLSTTLSGNDPYRSVSMGSTADMVAGTWYWLDDGFRVGGEVDLSLGIPAQDATTHNNLSTGHLFFQAITPSGVSMSLGGGTGLGLVGVGTPDYRLFASVAWAPMNKDRDGDGILDADDVCPNDPEDIDTFEDGDGCPDLDNDGDGIADLADSCALEPEDIDGFADADGCPDPDNDEDSFLDEADRCPNQAGPASGCPDTDGDGLGDLDDRCPEVAGTVELGGCADTDGDGVTDSDDACPTEAPPADEDPTWSDGCPKPVYSTGTAIALPEPLRFPSSRSTLTAQHEAALDQVAAFLAEAPYVVSVEVAGHSDTRESRGEVVSEQRAQAVADYLTGTGGVDVARITVVGHGASDPVDTNRTASGRDANRHVDLRITELAPASEPESALSPQGQAPGSLTVDIPGLSFAHVYIDDRKLTVTAPFRELPLAGGPHVVRVVNEAQQVDEERSIVVDGGPVLVQVGEANTPAPAESGSTSPWDAGSVEPADDPAESDPWDAGEGGDETETEAEDDSPASIETEADPWEVPWLDGEGEDNSQ